MANLLDIRRRIKSVKNTQQITRAMKMMSAARLKRAQDRVVAARPFASKMIEVMGEDRVMYAMDYPYQYVSDEVRWMDDLEITPSQKKKFFQTNAERWFKL
jgi:ATP synthase F1 gamma subunit